MNMVKLLLFLIIVTLSCFIHTTTSVTCPAPSFCGDLSFPIKYPFQLINLTRQRSNDDRYCSYPPKFSLKCNPILSKLVLNLPYSGDFYVTNISYIDKRIYIADPDNCLAKRLLRNNLELLSSPYLPVAFLEEYTLFSCPPGIVKRGYSSIPCLSNSSVSVVASKYFYDDLMHNNYNCSNVTRTISRVPTAEYNQYSSSSFDEIVLSWRQYFFISPCECCDNHDNGTHCDYNARPATSQGNESNTYIIAIPFVGIVLLVIFVIVLCKYSRRDSEGATPSQTSTSTVRQDLTAAQAQSTAVISGIDDSIIELCSVERIIGESFSKLISTSDYYSNICAICLSDFSPEEAIRCIVECQHYFHTGCIDEWLRLKGMCPVCRNILLP